jgi:hypothetical protein
MKPAALIATLFLSAVAVLHVLRLVLQVQVTAGSVTVPMWPSVLAVLGPGALAVWLWREQRQ